jgi:cytochrome c biogenesis protein CcdA
MSFKSKLNSRIQDIKIVYSNKIAYIITLVFALLMTIALFYFTHYETIVGNLGKTYANVQVFIQAIIAILFGINITLLWHKFKLAKGFDVKANGSTALGSFFALLVSGCPACGITLASYLGLSSIFASLPWFGLEIKIIGLLLLAYSTNYLLKNINSCKIN